jgi:hypothetical protein
MEEDISIEITNEMVQEEEGLFVESKSEDRKIWEEVFMNVYSALKQLHRSRPRRWRVAIA